MSTSAVSEPSTQSDLDGFDPLAEGVSARPSDKSIFEEATRRVVQNILKSYTGYFDLFAELLQNSLDAIDKRTQAAAAPFVPQLWITIDIGERRVRIVDNGSGMSAEEVRFCFRPNVSFKTRKEARGHKGVGATFLAYGFGLLRLATKTSNFNIAVRLQGGRQWADDLGNSYNRPKLEIEPFAIPELANDDSGTCVEISINKGQRPDLGWWGASTAGQWYQLLRMRTPLGGVYLSGKTPPKVRVHIMVRDQAGTLTSEEYDFVEYPYPHELKEVLQKVRSYDEIKATLAHVEGDASKIPHDFKRTDAFYGIWSASDILAEGSPFAGQNFTPEQEELLRRHDVSVYGCFLSTAKTWGLYQREILHLRRDPLLLRGGLLIASDYMVQGDLSVIPLTSTIGYQAATHVIVHFHDGNPDMGRKVFQPELKALADDLARQVVNIFKRYLYLMREDTGAADVVSDTDTYNWLEEKKAYRDKNPLELTFNGAHLAYLCRPNSEQDVVAAFHQLVGMGVVQGVRFLCTSEHDQYDGAYVLRYGDEKIHGFDATDRPLGVSRRLISQKESKPFVLEYKFDLDGLISDFEREVKSPNQINGIVCWEIGKSYQEHYSIRSYLIGDEGTGRQLFGATHSLWHQRMRLADVICVSDLIRFLQEPDAVRAEHQVRFRD